MGLPLLSLVTQQKKPPSGAPFTSTSAVNGLSVNASGQIVLGNDSTGAPGGVAKLLNTREIDTAGFTINLLRNQIGTNFLLQLAGNQLVFTTVAAPANATTLARGSLVIADGSGALTSQTLSLFTAQDAAGNLVTFSPTQVSVSPAAGGATSLLTLRLRMANTVAAQQIDIVNNTGVLELRTNNNTVLNASLSLTGLLAINGNGNTTYLSSLTALTNNAAAAVGTLTNAPVAGNPTKWIPFNDAGTTRNIPCW